MTKLHAAFAAFLAASFVSLPASADDNVIVPSGAGQSYLKTAGGDLWPLGVAYTTDGSGHILTMGGETLVSDNLIVPDGSGKAYLKDSLDRLFPAQIFYTTDGNGNVQPITGGSSGVAWGDITGTLSDQTDLQAALDAKQDSLSFSSPLVNTAGVVSCNVASNSQAGCLSSADHTSFAAKQAAGNYITALTGDATASGPGSSALTLASSGVSAGSYTLASVTVDAKGRVTSASSGTSNITHYYWVDPNGADSSSCGGVTNPCATLGQVATNIGSAASNAEFNDATKQFYYVKVNGTFTESPVFGTRPHIVLDLSSGVIIGDLTWQFNQGVIFGSNNQQPRFSVIGADLRAGYNGLFGYSGVNGNVFIDSVGSGSSLTAQLHMINTGVTGDIHQRLGSGGGVFTLSEFLTGTMVAGKVICDASPSAGTTTLYANNSDTSGSRAIGGVTGNVLVYQIHNVRFNGIVQTTMNHNGARWFDVQFAAVAHDFTSASGTVSMDANTFESWTTNVPTKGSVAAAYLDTARGVGYTPATSSNWSGAPTTVAGALDKLVVLQQSAVGSQPTCDSTHRGLSWLVQGGAGVADIYQICEKDASDVYGWVTH